MNFSSRVHYTWFLALFFASCFGLLFEGEKDPVYVSLALSSENSEKITAKTS